MITTVALLFSLSAFQDVAPPAPLAPVPSERQLAWHEREYYAFVHFGPNTFTGREWGEGREDPAVFAPSELDCGQWVRVFKDAGMSGVILTAKHHDGFCLWPSNTTEHTVARSPWKDGRGDVLRELSDACRAAGLWFGVYLSPWDRNHPAYGDSAAYNEVFRRQLREVLTGYGEVAEVWFDGACGEGPNGKRQVYDWPSFHAVVRELAPGACMFSDAGPDVRWVGNERGFSGETNWATLRRDEFYPGTPDSAPLTEGQKGGTHWVPAECDVSIRPGWFHRASEDARVKSSEELEEIWYASVGRGANLLLNVPPDRRGLVSAVDAERLVALRRVLDATFEDDLARGATATADVVRGGARAFGAQRVLDGDPATYWATEDATRTATLTLTFDAPVTFDRVVLREPIALGQRVGAFRVVAASGGEDVDGAEIARGTTIGPRRILRTPFTTATEIRIEILDARAAPLLSSVELHLAPPSVRVEPPAADFMGTQRVRLACSLPGALVRYTLDGTEPSAASPAYTGPLVLTGSAELRARVFDARGPGARLGSGSFRRWAEADLRPAVHFFVQPEAGLEFACYAGDWNSIAEVADAQPTLVGVAATFDPSVARCDPPFVLRFRGHFLAPADGIYTFRTTSSGACDLWIGEERLVARDGTRDARPGLGRIGLRAGFHPIRVDLLHGAGEVLLDVQVDGPVSERAQVPASALYR